MNSNIRESINKARATYYGFFAKIFAFVDKPDRFEGVKETLEILSEYPLDDESERAFLRLKTKLSDNYKKLEDEYELLFFDPSISIRTTASYYIEGFESGQPRVKMIDYLKRAGFKKDEEFYFDNEDDMGFIFNFMSILLYSKKIEFQKLQREIFENILNKCIDGFIESLIAPEQSDIFKDIAIVLNSFISFERVYLDISRPKATQKILKARVIPYDNLKHKGKGRASNVSCNISPVEEEETVEEV